MPSAACCMVNVSSGVLNLDLFDVVAFTHRIRHHRALHTSSGQVYIEPNKDAGQTAERSRIIEQCTRAHIFTVH